MSHMTSGFGPGSRGVLFSMLVLAAAAGLSTGYALGCRLRVRRPAP